MSMAGDIPGSDRGNNRNSGKINIYTCTSSIVIVFLHARFTSLSNVFLLTPNLHTDRLSSIISSLAYP